VAWASFIASTIVYNLFFSLGGLAVTYAVLKRRVLDFEFVLSRTLVVAGVSAIVVVSFVLLEWLLGTALVNASHATGLVANAALALVLGLSMSFIHKRVDAFVDFVFFHKRRENEQTLRDFAKEAAFVTTPHDLLDRAIEMVHNHTDASAAAVMLDNAGRFHTVRWFGDLTADASENDPLILAMKVKHTPVDPHHYMTAISGDLALPMLARNRLLGVLLLGKRPGGEAYAPDEVAALGELAQGVGTALESLGHVDTARERDVMILDELRALREVAEQTLTELRTHRTSSPA
jgi:GAF domain-containing protein